MDESTSHQFAPDMSTVLWLAYLTVDPAPLLPGPHRPLHDLWTEPRGHGNAWHRPRTALDRRTSCRTEFARAWSWHTTPMMPLPPYR